MFIVPFNMEINYLKSTIGSINLSNLDFLQFDKKSCQLSNDIISITASPIKFVGEYKNILPDLYSITIKLTDNRYSIKSKYNQNKSINKRFDLLQDLNTYLQSNLSRKVIEQTTKFSIKEINNETEFETNTIKLNSETTLSYMDVKSPKELVYKIHEFIIQTW